MKKIFLILLFLTGAFFSYSQNVGIGTASPTSKLHIVGTTRSTGNLSTDADFAVTGNAAIGGAVDPLYKLRVIGGDARIGGEFHATGNVGIGNTPDANYKLRVYSGISRFDGEAQLMGNVAINGDLDPLYKLRVYGGDARIGGEFHATGNVGIGNVPDAAFKLRVYGNSRLDGNAVLNGDLNVDNVDINSTLTINGKGSVRSNGASPLRIGFDSKYVNTFIANNARVSVTANISDFDGDLNDVRVIVSHVANDGGFLPWGEMIITPMGPDPVTNTVLIWITNKSGENGVLTGTIYLTTIAKN
jgi:cytoskeletal protein CcmA (bactofilin family)